MIPVTSARALLASSGCTGQPNAMPVGELEICVARWLESLPRSPILKNAQNGKTECSSSELHHWLAGRPGPRIFTGEVANMRSRNRRRSEDEGSSMIETALLLPLLVLMLCFAIDIGYFFIVAANLVSSTRNAVLYSAQGFVAPGQQQLPSAGSSGSLSDTAGVAGLAVGDLSGLASMLTRTTVQVCSKKLGVTQTSNGYVTSCNTFPSGSMSIAPDQDPDSNYGMLTQRVDVAYTVSPPIPLNFFLFTMPPLTVHWQAEMRALD